MHPPDLSTCEVDLHDGVLRVIIDHPPINLMDVAMMKDLYRLVTWIEREPAIRVVVVWSRDEEFFIAHADVERIMTYDNFVAAAEPDRLNGLVETMERWRRLRVPTIAVIAGIARGGGSEFALSLDMRFASIERAVLGQPEVAFGIIPGAGGTQRLAATVGHARAMEIVLGADDVDAQTAERYGYINRAVPDAQLEALVDRLAARIASFPAEAVVAAKQAYSRFTGEVHHDLLVEQDEWQRAFAGGEAKQRLQQFLDDGGQTRHGERRFPDLVNGI